MPFSSKRATHDEFYTLYESIEYIYKDGFINTDTLKDKIIYCCCDDYRWSNYVKFFKNNFEYFNIKKLIATNYDIGDGAYIYTYDGHNETIEQGRDDGSFENYNDFVSEDTIIIRHKDVFENSEFNNAIVNNQVRISLEKTRIRGDFLKNKSSNYLLNYYINYFTNEDFKFKDGFEIDEIIVSEKKNRSNETEGYHIQFVDRFSDGESEEENKENIISYDVEKDIIAEQAYRSLMEIDDKENLRLTKMALLLNHLH